MQNSKQWVSWASLLVVKSRIKIVWFGKKISKNCNNIYLITTSIRYYSRSVPIQPFPTESVPIRQRTDSDRTLNRWCRESWNIHCRIWNHTTVAIFRMIGTLLARNPITSRTNAVRIRHDLDIIGTQLARSGIVLFPNHARSSRQRHLGLSI